MSKEKQTIEEVETKEIRLIVPQFINVTRSFSHKLVPENYGIEGHRFAPLDFFASYVSQLPIDTPPEVVKEESERLYQIARGDVESAIKRELEMMRNPDGLSAEELDKVAPFVKLISESKIDEATSEILKAKDDGYLNEKQLIFLRKLISK